MRAVRHRDGVALRRHQPPALLAAIHGLLNRRTSNTLSSAMRVLEAQDFPHNPLPHAEQPFDTYQRACPCRQRGCRGGWMTWRCPASLHLHAPPPTKMGQQQEREAARLGDRIACACSAGSVADLSLAVLLQFSQGGWVQSATLSPFVASLLCFVESAGRRRVSGLGVCIHVRSLPGRRCNAQRFGKHMTPKNAR